MSATLLGAIVAGSLISLGLALAVLRLLPPRPDPVDAVARLTPKPYVPTQWGALEPDPTRTERLGQWALRTLPPGMWVRTPQRELKLLQIPLAKFYGDKLTFAALGLAIPVVLNLVFTAAGARLPFQLGFVASLGLAALMFFIPNYNAVDDARKARSEFRRALGAYVDLVALERTSGAGVRQSMEQAAAVSQSWVFTRISSELMHSRWSGVPPWDALRELADELALPDLADLADIMRLSGEQGSAAYDSLRARATAIRTAMLGEELAEANATVERMSIPGSLLGVVFMALLVAPALLRILTAS
ncbi:type II secretion system F family protein [Georgenia thermotolerans]|uniref:Type II secretion system protein GspF domain-containing protein n=1 Tax=Georgenia thermotolerans TaxID=527326 RepID=A0A7J5USD3_9MICO|nr:type II secretion system F family protein [Georgenia thermotolerans]KAE8765362.1 hypothetical protein GB883_04165 [Georgenia thermotolerans]